MNSHVDDSTGENGRASSAEVVVYDAFVSYSHTKDKALASAFQSVVQRIGKPWYRRRALRLFRDETSLSASPQLWGTIKQGLSRSRYLILFASEEAAASPWVTKEVTWWLDHRDSEKILIALTSGGLHWVEEIADFRWSETTPLPLILKGRFNHEPRWVDLRPFRNSASATERNFVAAGAEFAAAIHGRPKEDLLSEETRQQRIALRLAGMAVISLVAFLALAGWGWLTAETERQKAERNSEAAQKAARALIFDMAKDIRDDTGIPQTLVERILKRAAEVLEELAETSPDERSLLELQSDGLIEFGVTSERRKLLDQALSLYDKCRRILQPLVVGTAPPNPMLLRKLALCDDHTGRVLLSKGELGGAEQAFKAGTSIIKSAVDNESSSPELQLLLASAHAGIGRVQLQRHDVPTALASFHDGREAAKHIAEAYPGNLEFQVALADAHRNIGDALHVDGQFDEALSNYREYNRIVYGIVEKYPENIPLKSDLATSFERIGEALEGKIDYSGALNALNQSNKWREKVAVAKPDLAEEQYNLASVRFRKGRVLLLQKNFPEAALGFVHARALLGPLIKDDPNNIDYNTLLCKVYKNYGVVNQQGGNDYQALFGYHGSYDVCKKLISIQPNNFEWRACLIESYRNIGKMLVSQNNLDEAIEAYRTGIVESGVTNSVPDNADLQHSLFMSHVELREILLKAGKKLAAHQEALAALSVARGALRQRETPSSVEDLAQAEAFLRNEGAASSGSEKR